jgi:hypothetical protein
MRVSFKHKPLEARENTDNPSAIHNDLLDAPKRDQLDRFKRHTQKQLIKPVINGLIHIVFAFMLCLVMLFL